MYYVVYRNADLSHLDAAAIAAGAAPGSRQAREHAAAAAAAGHIAGTLQMREYASAPKITKGDVTATWVSQAAALTDKKAQFSEADATQWARRLGGSVTAFEGAPAPDEPPAADPNAARKERIAEELRAQLREARRREDAAAVAETLDLMSDEERAAALADAARKQQGSES